MTVSRGYGSCAVPHKDDKCSYPVVQDHHGVDQNGLLSSLYKEKRECMNSSTVTVFANGANY